MSSLQVAVPENLPLICKLEQVTTPSTCPLEPIVNSSTCTCPFKEPSTWIAPLAEISPRKENPSLRMEGLFEFDEMMSIIVVLRD